MFSSTLTSHNTHPYAAYEVPVVVAKIRLLIEGGVTKKVLVNLNWLVIVVVVVVWMKSIEIVYVNINTFYRMLP